LSILRFLDVLTPAKRNAEHQVCGSAASRRRTAPATVSLSRRPSAATAFNTSNRLPIQLGAANVSRDSCSAIWHASVGGNAPCGLACARPSSYRSHAPAAFHYPRLGFEATMKALLLALCLAASACGVASANESRHAAIVDMPEVATLSHATPDTWHTLPPVERYGLRTLNADACTAHAPSDFAQQHRHGQGAEFAF